MNLEQSKKKRQQRRKQHIRKHIFGNPERLRLSVNKSIKHITAQIIDDTKGVTLVSVSSIEKDVREALASIATKVAKSQYVGELLAKRAKEANISTVAFDRNGHLYHGRVKALAEAAREGGLQF
ncbi:MAG: 50S ribosomal protein L18 [Bacteroidetes bacterium]|nr:50S ribosomal protein L18 [bacterium]NBP63120.1 50S ribosomal protein L18 [Bacteroidota bacterium]